jgi:hypothetical protein
MPAYSSRAASPSPSELALWHLARALEIDPSFAPATADRARFLEGLCRAGSRR